MKICNNCENCRMDMDMNPYCSAVNQPWGRVLHIGRPIECGPEAKLWRPDRRGMEPDEQVRERLIDDFRD